MKNNMSARFFDVRDIREHVTIERGQADHRFLDNSIFQIPKTESPLPDAFEISVKADLEAIYAQIERNHEYNLTPVDEHLGFGASITKERKLSETIPTNKLSEKQTPNTIRAIDIDSPVLSRQSQKGSHSMVGSQAEIKQPPGSLVTPKPTAVVPQSSDKIEEGIKFSIEDAGEGDKNKPPSNPGKHGSSAVSKSSSGKLKDAGKLSLPLQNDSSSIVTCSEL
jgi:hypothetical protein